MNDYLRDADLTLASSLSKSCSYTCAVGLHIQRTQRPIPPTITGAVVLLKTTPPNLSPTRTKTPLNCHLSQPAKPVPTAATKLVHISTSHYHPPRSIPRVLLPKPHHSLLLLSHSLSLKYTARSGSTQPSRSNRLAATAHAALTSLVAFSSCWQATEARLLAYCTFMHAAPRSCFEHHTPQTQCR